MMAEALRLTIPNWVPDSCLSLNGRRRAHWRTISQAQREAGFVMDAVLLGIKQKRVLPYYERARVSVEFVYPLKRRRDPDGLAGLAKPLLDILVSWAVLKDDDSEHVDLTVRAVVAKGVTETRIEIEALGQPGREG